jgi:superfamily II DNA/RNA helicase
MDTTLYPTTSDLLRALVSSVPPATLQAMLNELGLGSVPHNRLLEDALVSILKAVPVLQRHLLGQVYLTLDQAAALLRTTPSNLQRLVQTEVVSGSGAVNTPANRQVIVATELLKHQIYFRRHLGELAGPPTVEAAESSVQMRYAPITRAFLSGLGEAARLPLIPDPFQQAAVTASLDSDVVVVAPSGSGKTWIAERAISRALANGQTVCYTTPLKALSNQKFRRFRTLFGYHSVGLLTGERRENTGAPILVATTEILRNQLYGQGPFPELIILDEAHYLADPDRGSAWEEVMVLAPPTSLLLLLSATISNAEVLADWMASIRPRRPELITTEVRSVPLRYGWLGEQRSVLPMGLAPYLLTPAAFRTLQVHHLPSLLQTLRAAQLLPAIIFWPTRRACDEAVAAFHDVHLPGARERADAYHEFAREYPLLQTHPLRHALIGAGVAPHHAGHLMAWRIVVEELLRGGLLSLVFATTTLAAGLDVPVRTVVLPNLNVWDTGGRRAMSALEFHQMVGRAGRRGKDRVGFVLLLPESQEALNSAQTLMTSAAEPLHSAFQVSYGQILALLGRFAMHEAREFWSQTFAAYEQRATTLALQRQLEILPDDPLEGRPCDDRLVTRHRYQAIQRHLAELKLIEPLRPTPHRLRPGRVVTLADGQLAVLLRQLLAPGHGEASWECLTGRGERRLCTAADLVHVSARLLDMGDIHPSDHVVTPLFSRAQLPPAIEVSPLTPLPVGSLVRQRPSGRLAIVHQVWRRGSTTVLEVLRADGRVETCRLEQIDSHYPVETVHPLLPLSFDSNLMLGQRVTVAGRRPNRGLLVNVEGTRLRGRVAIQLDGGKLLHCGMRRLRYILTYSQAALEPLIAQLRDVARTPSTPLYEPQPTHDRAQLQARLQELPCPRCALQTACDTSLRSLETLTRHRRELLNTITTLQAKVGGEFERRLRLLQRLGYVSEAGKLTADGQWARELRHPNELVVCELLRRQLAVSATAEEFAAVLAALTTERPPRRLIGQPTLFGLPELIRDLQRLEQQHGIPSPQLNAILTPVAQRWVEDEADADDEADLHRARKVGSPLPSAGERRAACLHRWATGAPWSQLVSWAGIDEGDLERLILQTAELLQQIEHLALPRYGALAHSAREAILRAPVA